MKTILNVDNLRKYCDPGNIKGILSNLKNTSPGIIGQPRATKAFELGLSIRQHGFNMYVSGVPGTGKLATVKTYLDELAKKEPVPGDWCYVNNFKDPYQPKKLGLPSGRGFQLKKDVKDIIRDAKDSLLKAFESEEYANRKTKIKDQFEKQQAALISAINKKAEKESLIIRQTPLEIFTVPVKAGEPMTEEQFNSLPELEQHEIRKRQDLFAEDIKAVLSETRKLAKATNTELYKLEKEVATYAISSLIEDISEKYVRLPEVIDYLNNIKQDILDNLSIFLSTNKTEDNLLPPQNSDFIKRYEVNVLIDNSKQEGAPIIIEQNPTYNNLIGRIEKESVMGTLITDFSMIRKGSLLSANGGYLVIRAEELFKNYFSWEALKRTISNKELIIEEATEQLGYFTTKTLQPEPIPLQVKVILIGNPFYYHLLYAYDSDFRELFKIKAEFDSSMERTEENTGNYILFVNKLVNQENLISFNEDALAKIVEFGSRLADDQYKLSTRFALIEDIVQEANHYAKIDNSSQVLTNHVQHAIEEKWYRGNLLQEKVNELIQQKQIFIDITGAKIGQVNGLSVIDSGDISFGRPSRITCSVSLGKGGIIAIEREAELSGPLHTKGVLILTGYIAEKYFQDKPASLSAHIVFEQSYGEIEGDSASSTELYAILSNLAQVPIKQGIAVTGSVNQKGEIQAIGGVNEKIEGYFEVCKRIGLNGEQGVIIPAVNVRNLMLKEDVLEAVKNKQFTIWAIDSIDEGIEILTGIKAGPVSEEETVACRVNNTLNEYAKKMLIYNGGESNASKDIVWESEIV